MQLVAHDPTEGVYPTTDDYVHAMEVVGAQRLLFVAGTMGLDPRGAPGATLAEQLDLIWANIRAIIASAGMTVENIVRLTSYLRDASYAEANAAARVAALGGRPVPTTAVVVQTLVSDWLVEIEVVCAASWLDPQRAPASEDRTGRANVALRGVEGGPAASASE
jgi:enamine deaminase RidA (YjgF/YER057c/UK114 family)